MTAASTITELDELMTRLEADAVLLQHADLDGLSPEDELEFAKRLETVRRRIDHGTDRATEHLDRSGAFSVDGHRNVGGALKHACRITGAEVRGRGQTIRVLRELPYVTAAYEAGDIPVGHMRAIARTVANPRVQEHLEVADPMFAEVASVLRYAEFVGWLLAWERDADPDGTGEAAEENHERRTFSLLENALSGAFVLAGLFGAVQGASMAEILQRYEQAEFEADWADARRRHGPDATVDQLPRTPQQRRADAVFAIFRAAEACRTAGSPEPLVNVVIDQDTFEDELRRTAGEDVPRDPNDRESRVSRTIGGTQLTPTEVVALALVGHVRRVVVDGAGTVIDLGRRQRLFRGSSREAVKIQALLRGHTGLRCVWPGCDAEAWHMDHREPAARGGPTSPCNGDPLCGCHNRIKERGFRPVRGSDGEWTILRPDGSPIAPPV